MKNNKLCQQYDSINKSFIISKEKPKSIQLSEDLAIDKTNQILVNYFSLEQKKTRLTVHQDKPIKNVSVVDLLIKPIPGICLDYNDIGLAIPQIREKFGDIAAYNAKILSFEKFLKNLDLPVRDVISVYSYLLLKADKKDYENIIFLCPEMDLEFKPKGTKVWFSDGEIKNYFEIIGCESKEFIMFESVQVGAEKDKLTPVISLVRYPLSVWDVSVKRIEPFASDKPSLNQQFFDTLVTKYPYAHKNSELFVASLRNKAFKFEDKGSIQNSNIQSFLSKLLNYREAVLKNNS